LHIQYCTAIAVHPVCTTGCQDIRKEQDTEVFKFQVKGLQESAVILTFLKMRE
jgi:hypothetical protein